MPNAKLYTVQTSKGTVYAVHDLSTNMIWTERSEHAARQLAHERRVSIIEEQSLSHVDLLRLMGHEPPAPKFAASRSDLSTAVWTEPLPDEKPKPAPITPLASAGIAARYHWDDDPIGADDETIIIPRASSPPVKSVFCSEGELGDSIPGAGKPEKDTTPGGFFVEPPPKGDSHK